MSIRVDPRRLSLLKELAGQEGLRPGQLVQRWVEERLDAERTGGPLPQMEAAGTGRMDALETAVASLGSRLDALAARLDSLQAAPSVAPTAAAEPPVASAPRRRGRPPRTAAPAASPAGDAAAAPHRRGRPPGTGRKARSARRAGGPRVPLHEELVAIIGERGPMSAADLARAVHERGRYSAPRSARPLDAATVNSRVSNPVYRARFARSGGKIGLAE